MTLQYDQDNINLRDAAPISVTTPDIVPVLVTLDVLTENGQTLLVSMYGGGSAPISAGNPGGVNTNNYSVATADAVFTREGGVGLGVGAVAVVNFAGTPPALTFVIDDVTIPGSTICQLSIVGPAFEYVNRLKISKIRL
jgi:hypothetical protein